MRERTTESEIHNKVNSRQEGQVEDGGRKEGYWKDRRKWKKGKERRLKEMEEGGGGEKRWKEERKRMEVERMES